MAVIEVVPLGSYSGTINFGPVPIPQGITAVRGAINIDQILTPVQGYAATIEISYDNGTTWGPLIGVFYTGAVQKPGLTVQNLEVSLAQAGLTTRQVRGTVVITGTVTTRVVLTVT